MDQIRQPALHSAEAGAHQAHDLAEIKPLVRVHEEKGQQGAARLTGEKTEQFRSRKIGNCTHNGYYCIHNRYEAQACPATPR